MLILGLTGGYCAGKNKVAAFLEEYGWRVSDVDKLGHEAVAQSSPALIKAFGPSIAADDGSIDRKKLGRLVFADADKLRLLETIVHPAMFSLLDQQIETARREGADRFCINAALLYRFPQVPMCSAIIEVRAPLYLRIARAQARDGISVSEALERIARQRQFWDLRPADVPLFMLWNTGSVETLHAALASLLAQVDARALHRA